MSTSPVNLFTFNLYYIHSIFPSLFNSLLQKAFFSSKMTLWGLEVTLSFYNSLSICFSLPVCLSIVALAPPPDNKNNTCRSELLDPAVPGHDSTVAECSEGGLFTGKRFLLVGFGTEAEGQLSTLVVENYGKVLVGRFRGVADYAIVPLLGCEVEATVDEVVTDTWLVRRKNILK